MKHTILLLSFCLTVSSITSAEALTTDSSQPLNITSDQFTYNDAQSVAIYQGHVIGIQGSRYLTADKVIVQLDQNKEISKVDAYGNPAHYHYQPKPQDPLIYASAKTIEYAPSSHLLSLIGNGKVTQQGNIFKGELITYNTDTQVIESKGATTNNRPLMVIQPYTQTKASPHAKPASSS